MNKSLIATLLGSAFAAAFTATPALAAGPFDGASKAWTFAHDGTADYQSEIVSFDRKTGTLWVAGVSGVDVLDAKTGSFLQRIDTSAFGSINSVSIHNGLAAFAIESATRTDAGVVKLYNTATRGLAKGVNSIAVGVLPDMLTFTRDGSKLLVANEGTPDVYGALTSAPDAFPRTYAPGAADPVGSVSIIDMGSRSLVVNATLAGVTTGGSHIRANTGMDFEPEYIAVNGAGTKAYVSLQEANAMGVLNLQTNSFEKVIGLGVKDFSAPGNRIDPLPDGTASLVSVNVKGLYMPDGMAAYEASGKTFVVMANEGDYREDDGDRSSASSLGEVGSLAALRVSNTDSSAGDLYAAGARSFSIRDENGALVYDSGEILDAQAIALGIYDDGRSRDKGVEPEGLELLTIGARTFAVVGLERTTSGALAVFDITDPAHTSFVRMLVSPGDVAPEGLKGYVLDGQYFLAFSNEGSNTTSVFQLAAVPEPGTWALMLVGVGMLAGVARRRAR